MQLQSKKFFILHFYLPYKVVWLLQETTEGSSNDKLPAPVRKKKYGLMVMYSGKGYLGMQMYVHLEIR